MNILENYFKPGAIIELGDYNLLIVSYPYRICKIPVIKYLFVKRIDLEYPNGNVKTHKLYKITPKINNGWNLKYYPTNIYLDH